jgi:hypothetical protein
LVPRIAPLEVRSVCDLAGFLLKPPFGLGIGHYTFIAAWMHVDWYRFSMHAEYLHSMQPSTHAMEACTSQQTLFQNVQKLLSVNPLQSDVNVSSSGELKSFNSCAFLESYTKQESAGN